MSKTKVIFRADGNSTIGLGHIYRLLALMQMLDDSFACYFMIKEPTTQVRSLILDHCEHLIALEDKLELKNEADFLLANHLTHNDILVLDGYDFDVAYKTKLKESGIKLVCIDDLYVDHGSPAVIINHGGDATKNKFPDQIHTQYCLGPKFALLRPPFWQYAQQRNKDNEQVQSTPSNLFICFGGADPDNNTLSFLNQIDKGKINKCYVIIGSAYQHANLLRDYAKRSEIDIEILSDLSANELVDVMGKCDTAVTSASTISYEYLSIGGSLYLKQTVDNQVHLFNYLIENKLAFNIDDFPLENTNKITDSLAAQNSVFDGLQAKRFNYVFKSLTLDIRLATESDTMMYYKWANEKLTRAQSFSQASIPLEDHMNWFKVKVNSNLTTMYVIEANNLPIGQVRFDVANENAVISFSLDKDYRGKGLGIAMLHRALIAYTQDQTNKSNIIGYVKKENIPSQKAFRLLAFKEEETDVYKNSYQYIYSHGV